MISPVIIRDGYISSVSFPHSSVVSVCRGFLKESCEKCYHSLLGTVTLVTTLSRISLCVEGFPPSSSFVQHSCGVKRSSFVHPRDVRHGGLRFFYGSGFGPDRGPTRMGTQQANFLPALT